MTTITTINSTDKVWDSRSVINTNFANLNNDKIETSTLDTDTTLAANSDAKIATQKAVKAYIDSIAEVMNLFQYKWVIDASSNPNYPAANAWHAYRVSVAGKVGWASGKNVEVNDFILCGVDGSSSWNEASVWANWSVLQVSLDPTDYVTKALYDANTILYATSDNTPVALTVGPQAIVGRAGGNIAALAIDSDLSSVSANDDTVPSAKATKAAIDNKLECIIIAVSDETTAITTGNAKVTFRMPYAFTLTSVKASLTTASSSWTPTFDINEWWSTILSTKITIDATELTSATAAIPPVISDAALAADAEITIDIDVAWTWAKWAKIYLIGHQ